MGENHGVDPDDVVEDEPAHLLAGRDAQLETAVGLMLKALEGCTGGLPKPLPLIPPPAGRPRPAQAMRPEGRPVGVPRR